MLMGIPLNRIRNPDSKAYSSMLQLVVLCFGTFQNRDSGVSVFPKCEERLVRSFRLRLISRPSEHSAELQMRQWADGIQAHETAMMENLLKLGRGFRITVSGNKGLAAHIRRVQTAKVERREVEAIHRQLIGTSDF